MYTIESSYSPFIIEFANVDKCLQNLIFIPEEGSNTLIDVLLEQYDDFDIYWYHWPQDGYVFWVEDYEPGTCAEGRRVEQELKG